MAPESVRLIRLESQTVEWFKVDGLPWDKVWTISHLWDGKERTKIPLTGVSWESNSFSSEKRFSLMFDKTCEIVKARGAKYIWLDAACIDQGGGTEEEIERKEQIPFMGSIYGRSAGCVAFGRQTSNDRFAEILSVYDDGEGQKAWVSSWFERVWTYQELQLPQELFFVSGDHVLTREDAYLFILLTSPYLTSPNKSPAPNPNETTISAQDVVNALSPLSKSNTQRSLMQSSRRGCSSDYINDKVYGMLGVLSEPFLDLEVDYKIPLARAVLNLMALMSSKDVLDSLTFNTLSPADNIHDTLHWSGMVRLDEPAEHPSYEKDIYPPETNALVVGGGSPLTTTRVHKALLWQVVISESTETSGVDLVDTEVRAWPTLTSLSEFAKLTADFSKVDKFVDYSRAIERAERSLVGNWTSLEPLLKNAVNEGIGGETLSSFLQNPPTKAEFNGLPNNRLGDKCLFGREVTVLLCRSKADGSFHYGIVVQPNEDGTWHKVCTAAFSNSCIHSSGRVEEWVVIGR